MRRRVIAGPWCAWRAGGVTPHGGSSALDGGPERCRDEAFRDRMEPPGPAGRSTPVIHRIYFRIRGSSPGAKKPDKTRTNTGHFRDGSKKPGAWPGFERLRSDLVRA